MVPTIETALGHGTHYWNNPRSRYGGTGDEATDWPKTYCRM